MSNIRKHILVAKKDDLEAMEVRAVKVGMEDMGVLSRLTMGVILVLLS